MSTCTLRLLLAVSAARDDNFTMLLLEFLSGGKDPAHNHRRGCKEGAPPDTAQRARQPRGQARPQEEGGHRPGMISDRLGTDAAAYVSHYGTAEYARQTAGGTHAPGTTHARLWLQMSLASVFNCVGRLMWSEVSTGFTSLYGSNTAAHWKV